MKSSQKSSTLTERQTAVVSGRIFRDESGRLSVDACTLNRRYCRLITDPGAGSQKIEVAISGLPEDCDISICIEDNQAILQRNRFGRQPLYWTTIAGELHFSTHCQDLVARLDANCRSIDTSAFHAYSCFSFVPSPLAPFSEIHSVPAGSKLTFGPAWERWRPAGFEANEASAQPQLCSTDFWKESSNTPPPSEDRIVEQLRALIGYALEQQAQDLKNEDIAVFLSGGLDSALTAAALKRAGAKVTAYSLDFGNYGRPELPLAIETAEYLQIPLVKVACTPKEIRKHLQEAVTALDTVFGDGVTVPLFLLARAAADNGHTIAFNGEGGDQLFAGWTNKPLIASTVYSGNEGSCAENKVFENQFYEKYLGTFHKIYGFERNFLSSSIVEKCQADNLRAHLNPALQNRDNTSLMHVLRRANLMLKGAQNIQPRASNLATYHGLNLRTLFCNEALSEFTFSIPPDLLLRGATEKYILKRAVDDWLPEPVVTQEKRGMGAPLTEWCLGPLWHEIGRYLDPRQLEVSSYWQKDIAQRVALCEINAAWQGRRIGEILWLILNWEVWLANTQAESTRGYNPFWPPLLVLKLKKEVFNKQ